MIKDFRAISENRHGDRKKFNAVVTKHDITDSVNKKLPPARNRQYVPVNLFRAETRSPESLCAGRILDSGQHFGLEDFAFLLRVRHHLEPLSDAEFVRFSWLITEFNLGGGLSHD
jgi:hypothetical protein